MNVKPLVIHVHFCDIDREKCLEHRAVESVFFVGACPRRARWPKSGFDMLEPLFV